MDIMPGVLNLLRGQMKNDFNIGDLVRMSKCAGPYGIIMDHSFLGPSGKGGNGKGGNGIGSSRKGGNGMQRAGMVLQNFLLGSKSLPERPRKTDGG